MLPHRQQEKYIPLLPNVLATQRITMQILFSQEHSPALNAAIEERLFRAAPLLPTLLFYRNTPTVLFGRNQNPWQECDLRWCQRNQVAVLRRISGGGTVFHDLGNLNYAFIVPRGDYDQIRYLNCIVTALQNAGIAQAELREHFAIWVAQHKVAGSAFALSGRAALLHGCLLVEADLELLHHALRQNPHDHFIASAVASNRVPVINLRELRSDINCDGVQAAIMEAAQSLGYKGTPRPIAASDFKNDSAFADAVSTFTSEAWTFARTADFTLQRQGPQGLTSLDVSQGRVRQAILRSYDAAHNLPQLQGLELNEAFKILEQPLVLPTSSQAFLKH
jgi:lipoate-protein ligase A